MVKETSRPAGTISMYPKRRDCTVGISNVCFIEGISICGCESHKDINVTVQ